jgi:type I restriction enzyme M protein
MTRKQEQTDIDQFLYPQLDGKGIKREQVRRDTTTRKTKSFRGDLWISTELHDSPVYEEHIVALIECKTHKCNIGDLDWQDAVNQGKKKAILHGLNAFYVSNTKSMTRCYNANTLEEIVVDGNALSSIPNIPVMKTIETQVNSHNSEVFLESFSSAGPDPKKFRSALWNIRQVFRSSGVSKGSEESMIKTTLTFGILKLIFEQQSVTRTIPGTILLWNDWRDIGLDREIKNTIDDLVKIQKYKHLEGCLDIDNQLDSASCLSIKNELNSFNFLGSDFDFFGLIYESMANGQIKKDFGEFYTPRHIIRSMVKILLKDETHPRPIKICDPACGTGGFLVESFLYLQHQYKKTDTLNETTLHSLRNATFYGLDTNDKVAIPFARTNMMMADDGGANIQGTEDSLIALPENEYDFILANVPYGKYDGNADITNFSYTNQKRYELLFLEKIVKALKSGGKAAVIVPDGLVESTSNNRFRQTFLHDVTIEAVISLPNFVFEPYTTEKTYILVFHKKRPADIGRIQDTPIWHYIIDNDGFRKGKKRYPINDNDLPFLESGYLKSNIDEKCGFVNTHRLSEDSYWSLCSEYYLRVPTPVDISIEKFEGMLSNFEQVLKNFE